VFSQKKFKFCVQAYSPPLRPYCLDPFSLAHRTAGLRAMLPRPDLRRRQAGERGLGPDHHAQEGGVKRGGHARQERAGGARERRSGRVPVGE
jgi:hypothetical protein